MRKDTIWGEALKLPLIESKFKEIGEKPSKAARTARIKVMENSAEKAPQLATILLFSKTEIIFPSSSDLLLLEI